VSCIGIFLIVSELDLFKKWFARHWPVLSNESGLVCLGLAMISLGFTQLGNLNKMATSVQNLGLPMWRVVIASGILSSVFGFLNIVGVCIINVRKRRHGLTNP
jgi:hypothetical protein